MNGAATAHRLHAIANDMVQKVDDADPMKSMDELRTVAAIGKIANEQAHIGLNLLAANKGQIAIDQSKTAVPRTLADFYGEQQS